MLRKLLPNKLKALLKGAFRTLLHDNLPEVLPRALPFAENFFPHHPREQGYAVAKTAPPAEFHALSPLPVPPRHLWLDYGQTAEEYLVSGQKDIQVLADVLERSGATLPSAGHILELGCAAGRMIRWLADLTETCEVWGTDISATSILWCQQHLSPPLHFALTGVWPQLPFEDRHFGLIYAGSIFTHIDDLAPTWFLELRRVLRPGGKLWCTIHDRHTMDLLEGAERNSPLAQQMHASAEYEKFRQTDFGMFTLGRSMCSQVFYDVDFLRRRLEPFYRVLTVVEEAYGYQTGVLLERV